MKGGFTSTASRSRASEVEAGSPSFEVEEQKEDLPSSRNQYLEELAEDVLLTKTKRTKVEEGGFFMCGVEEQQAVRFEAQPQKRRAVIRVESEETQDYVMERRKCGYPNQEEVEEIGFVPSAVSEPAWALHLCDKKCSNPGFKYFQLVAVVSEENGAVRTNNLCQQCYNERRVQQGEQPVEAAQWKEMVELKAYRGKLWKVFGMEQFVRGVWEHFTVRRTWAKAVLADAEKEKQEDTGKSSRP